MGMLPSDYRVDYGRGEHAVFQDRARAEQMAVRLHGVVVPLYDLRDEQQRADAAKYLAEQADQWR